jgi:hypothetical protein
MLLVGVAFAAVAALVFVRFAQTSNAQSSQQIAEKKAWDLLHVEDWHEFTPPSEKFKVLVPTLPQHATEKIGDPKTKEARIYDMYVSQKENGSIFMISLITLLDNPNKSLDEKMLASVVDNMLTASPNTKVKLMQMGQYKEYPAIDFSIENEQVNVDGKAFLVGNTLYLLTTVSKQNDYNRKEFEFFANSFQLMPAGNSEVKPKAKPGMNPALKVNTK